MADNQPNWLDKFLTAVAPGGKFVANTIATDVNNIGSAVNRGANTSYYRGGANVGSTAAKSRAQTSANLNNYFTGIQSRLQKPSVFNTGTTSKPIGTKQSTWTPSMYGIGAAGAFIGKAKPPTPLNSQIIKNLSGATGGSGSVQGATGGFTADQLYIDPSNVYQPLYDLYDAQRLQLNERYGKNAADITNIFGNLTTVRAQDKAKIAQQYQTSIEQQQQALAQRTAEARQGVAAGQQGAAQAAGEMGTAGQPAPSDSLTSQAAEQGIADSYAYQTTWDKLQNVMSQQAQNDVDNEIRGYNYQKASALESLRNSLEDRLAAIEGNVAGTKSQQAAAELQGRQNVANTKYQEAQDAKAQKAALAAAQAAAAAKANKPTDYSKDVYGWSQRVSDAGKNPDGILSSVNQAATAEMKAQKARGNQNPKLTKANLLNRWLVMFQGDPSTSFAIDYIKNFSGYN